MCVVLKQIKLWRRTKRTCSKRSRSFEHLLPDTHTPFVPKTDWWLETNCFQLCSSEERLRRIPKYGLSFFFKLLTHGKKSTSFWRPWVCKTETPTVSNCFPDFYKYTLRIQNVHRERIPARRNETIAVRRVGVRRGVLRRRDVDRYSLFWTWKRLVFFLRNILLVLRWILVRGFDVFVARARWRARHRRRFRRRRNQITSLTHFFSHHHYSSSSIFISLCRTRE